MKSLTIVESEKLVNKSGWTFTQDWEKANKHLEDTYVVNSLTDELVKYTQVYCYGWIAKNAVFGEFEISYEESFSYIENDEESLTVNTDGQDVVWRSNFLVVDEEGEEIDIHQVSDHIPEIFSELELITLRNSVVDICKIDITDDAPIFEIKSSIAPTLKFSGRLIATDYTNIRDSQSFGWHGVTSELYITSHGKIVASQQYHTTWALVEDKIIYKILDKIEDAVDFFGQEVIEGMMCIINANNEQVL